ncbi:YggS family pyridoxal phosphate-dependent enzyme [Gandjariella thermophila]|uniref:Pyridoxal phosphate homeostasis protein n=1 Tax=Gandjariella thermophila TaxID=1931992 RepID=A0A4D4JEM2_9PSEU|nr:YggS family pyridoxal phosphate-dependent enzyme [Gandjariella thermophila]GDY32806.1 YggS family pyridoxal phosphate enzyme [Gandjariella thermophila]
MSAAEVTGERRAELAEALHAVRERIDAACASAGRDPSGVRMIAVTKTFPATDVAMLTDLGLTDFGENRDQEARRKVEELAGLRPDAAARWHMVGRLQRNKARSVVRWAAEVQSVDSPRLADALARAVASARDAGERAGPLDVLVQASLDADPGRGGCPLPELPALADTVAASGELALRGVMLVAPMEMDPGAAFDVLSRAWQRIRRDHPEATELSAGMSGDMEAAIRHGSTCVRVGTALLGGRRIASP